MRSFGSEIPQFLEIFLEEKIFESLKAQGAKESKKMGLDPIPRF
jgi:hypothetical protein